MRKLKLFSVLMCLFIGIGQMWGTDVTLNSFGSTTSGTSYVETEGSLTDDASNTWKVKGYRVTSDGLIIGKGGANYLKTPNFSGNISSVTVTWSGNTSYYLALQTADGSTELEAHTNPSSATAYTFDVEGSYTQLRLVGRRASGTQNAAATITSVVVSYGGGTPNPTISAGPEDATYGVGDVATALSVTATGTGTLHYQWKSNTTNSIDGATNVGTDAATYTPSTSSVGTTYYFCVVTDTKGAATSSIAAVQVKAKHNIIFNNGGVKTIVNASVREGETYNITETIENSLIASCTYKKFEGWTRSSSINANVKPTLVTSVEMEDEDVDLYAVYSVTSGGSSSTTPETASVSISVYAQAHSWAGSGSPQVGEIPLNEDITATTNTDGNNGKYYSDWRLYQSNSGVLTITASEGCELTSVTFTYGTSNGGVLKDGTITVATGSEYEISGSSKSFSVGNSGDATNGQARITVISVNYEKTTSGTTTYSLDAVCTAPTCDNLDAPTLDEITKTYNSATIAWNEVTDAVEYAVSVVNNATSENVFTGNIDALSKALEDLEPATQYDYTIMAVGDGTEKCAEGNGVLEGNFTTDAAPDYTLTLSENGVTRTFKLAGDVLPKLNSSVDLPTESDQTCEGKVLVGWSTSSVAKTDVAPALVPNPYTLSDATNKAETLYAVYAKETIDKVAGNPVVYDGPGGSAALTALPYVTAYGLGSDYAAGNSPYLVKFDTEGDYIQFSLDYAPTSVTFAYKMLGGANTSHVIFKECATADGEYSQVESLEISGAQNSTGTLATSETFSQKYVRMVFNKGHNVGIGAITVTGFVGEPSYSQYASVCDPKYTITLANDGNGTAKFDNNDTEKQLPEGATAQIIATPAAHYNFAAWTYDSEKVEVADPTSATTAITAKASAATITATFTIKSTHNVTFKSNGNTIGEPAIVYDGETVTLLGAPAAYDANYPYFIGWSATDFKKQATAPTLVTGEEAITGDVTYHAVFGNVNPADLTNNYKKITSNLVSGNYVFAITDGKAMNAAVSEKTAAGVDVTINEDIISNPAANIIWQVTKNEENYTLYNAGTAKYMNIVADGDYGQLALEDDAAAYTAQFGATNQDIILRSATITGQLIEYYNGFKSYSHSGTAIYAFQQQHATPTEWVTKEVASYQVKYYDNVDGEDIAVPADDVAIEGEDYNVSTTEAVRPGYQFIGWNTDNTANTGIAKVEDVQDNINLYAIWEANPICTIHFSVRGEVKAGMDVDVLQGKAYDGFAGKTIETEDEVEGFTCIGWASAAQVAETTSTVEALTSLTPEIQASASEVTVFAIYKRTVDNGQKTDVITADDLEADGTTYKPFSDVHKASNAYYAGGSAYGNAAIQLRSSNSDAGVISTTSGGQIKSVVLEWEEHTDAARVIAVYGKNTAYAGIAELYDSETQGTNLGEIAVSGTTLNVTGDYAYVGIRSKSGALYLNQISITWQDVTNYYTTKPVVIDHLELSGTYPTVFDKGDAFSHEGMTVKAVYSDDAKVDVTADATFSGYEMSTPGDQTVTVSYGGKSTTYNITVNPPTLTSIYLDGTYQTLFAYNSTFNHNGMTVMAVYSDASEADVTSSASFSTPNMVQAGLQDVTVTYETEEAVYAIRVIPANTDYITAAGIGAGVGGYESWSGKKDFGTISVYAGNSMVATGTNAGAIQLKSKDNSGIVLTSSNGLYLKNLSVTVKSGTNTLNVYAKNTAYSSAADLYDEATCGTLIGTVSATGEMIPEAGISYNDNYQYIGLRSANNALYLTDITITWGDAYVAPTEYTVLFTSAHGTEPDPVEAASVTLVELTEAGWTHTGWTADADVEVDDATVTAGTLIANGKTAVLSSDVEFTAVWEEVTPTPVDPDYTEVRNGLTPNAYYTMCLDKAVISVKAGSIWRVLSKAQNGTDIILEEVTTTVAGRPYIIYATETTFEVEYTGDAVGAPVNDDDNNGLVGSFEKASITKDANNYIIYNNALYYVNSDEVYVGANRAYLNMGNVPAYSNDSQQGAPRRRVTMAVYGEQVATGMDELNASEAPVKVMIDGKFYILRGEKMYDATGKLVK